MDRAEIQESKVISAVFVSGWLSSADPSCIWVEASSPCSSSSGSSPLSDSILLCPELVNDRPCADRAPPPPSRLEFMQSFVNTLLPQLKSIHSRSSSISLQAKLSAVRVAADMSFAVSARRRNNNIWSRALLQDLSNSYRNKLGGMKDCRRYPPSCRRKIYARILRRCNMRMQDCSGGSGRSSRAYGRARRNCYQASRGSYELSSGSGLPERLEERCASNVRCWKCCCSCTMRHAMSKRRCGLGLPSYLKVLRNSRGVKKLAQKTAVEPGNKASKMRGRTHISKEQIVSLGGLVPGGHSMDVPLLFQEAADYILSLQMQVEALQSLSRSVSL